MDDNKAAVIGVMWLTFLAVSTFLIVRAGGWGILGVFVLSIPLMAITTIMWTANQHEESSPATEDMQPDKRKRETLDAVLRDLSTEQLETLKQRIEDEVITDEVLHHRLVGEDGEFTDAYADDNDRH